MKAVLLLPAALILAAAPQDTVTVSPALLSISGGAGTNPQSQSITIVITTYQTASGETDGVQRLSGPFFAGPPVSLSGITRSPMFRPRG